MRVQKNFILFFKIKFFVYSDDAFFWWMEPSYGLPAILFQCESPQWWSLFVMKKLQIHIQNAFFSMPMKNAMFILALIAVHVVVESWLFFFLHVSTNLL